MDSDGNDTVVMLWAGQRIEVPEQSGAPERQEVGDRDEDRVPKTDQYRWPQILRT